MMIRKKIMSYNLVEKLIQPVTPGINVVEKAEVGVTKRPTGRQNAPQKHLH
jgi:hypothetical protein